MKAPVDVQITKEEVLLSSTDYSTILILDAFDSSSITPSFSERVRRYTSLEELLQEGWGETSKVYLASKTIFLQERRPPYILVGRKDPTLKEGKEVESITQALNAILEENDKFYGIISPLKEKQQVLDIADFIQVRDKIYHVSLSDDLLLSPQDTSSLAHELKNKKYNQTIITYYGEAQKEIDPFIEGAVLVAGFSETLGSINWSTISLTGIEPSLLSDSAILSLKEKNVNFYTTIYNLQRFQEGKCIGGEWIDIITGIYLMKNEIQESMTDLLKKSYSKTSYTTASFALIEATLDNVLFSFTQKGKDLITDYFVQMPKVEEVPSSDKERRELNIGFVATLAGAINYMSVKGYVSYDGNVVIEAREEA